LTGEWSLERMHKEAIERWQHQHVFAQDRRQAGELRTRLVLGITLVTMVVEIAAGIRFGSVALLADGLHMGSHATALGVSTVAYVYARRHAGDPRFTFGTGKVNALGGYTGALLLLAFAAAMAWEGAARLLDPQPIQFDWAILVAIVGLVVNALSVVILGAGRGHDHAHRHDHGHAHGHERGHHHHHAGQEHDLNLVARWSIGLLRETAGLLLDQRAPTAVRRAVQEAIEGDADNRLFDLHVWSVAPGSYAAILGVVTHHPRPPEHYQGLLPAELGIVHVTVEVRRCEPGRGQGGELAPA
jgi:Co/Zn/Cd efflux system component